MAKKKELIEPLDEVVAEAIAEIEVTEEVVESPKKELIEELKPKKEFALYPLKKATKIGSEIRPIGYNISLTKEGYKFFKQQNIV